MPQQYDPLSQEDDSIRDVEPESADSLHAGLLPRPAVYYGEGPFNAPSSDEEDEVAEKDGTGSPNRAEHGNLLGSELVDDDRLYVGGRRKVCAQLLAWTGSSSPPAGIPFCPGASRCSGCTFDALGGDRSLCRSVLQRKKTRRARERAHHLGSHLQRHISCRANGPLLGSGRYAPSRLPL